MSDPALAPRWTATVAEGAARRSCSAPATGFIRRSFDAVSTRIACGVLRSASHVVARRKLHLRVEGLDNVPEKGPVLLAARHFHHFYDGVVLMDAVPRPLHILVALDWVDSQPLRRLMEWATRTAGWPAVLREEGLTRDDRGFIPHPRSAFRRDEVERYRLRSIRDSVGFLCAGRAVVIFPEGYPNVDPRFTPKRSDDEFLEFRSGFTTVVSIAQRRLQTTVPIIPTGLAYERGARWRVVVRFGAPLYWNATPARAELIRTVQRRVEILSRPS